MAVNGRQRANRRGTVMGPLSADAVKKLLKQLGLSRVHAARLGRGYALEPVTPRLSPRGDLSLCFVWRLQGEAGFGLKAAQARHDFCWRLSPGQYIAWMEEAVRQGAGRRVRGLGRC